MISFEEAKRLLRYDPQTGEIVRLVKTSNYAKMGVPAGCIGRNGYLTMSVRGKHQYLHHLAWLLVTGEWPKQEIDHRNGKRADNRWENLRAASSRQNKQNRVKGATNKSGFKGVCWGKREQLWRATITPEDGRQRYLGTFDCPVAAHLAYVVAADVHFGEFARAA